MCRPCLIKYIFDRGFLLLFRHRFYFFVCGKQGNFIFNKENSRVVHSKAVYPQLFLFLKFIICKFNKIILIIL